MSTAKRRWKLLGDVIKKKRLTKDEKISIRRFTSFDLFKATPMATPTGDRDHHSWFHYTCDECPQFSVSIRHHDGSFQLTELNGFNNTGNVCIWPSEQILTYYCLQNSDRFNGRVVCELGGGMTCLAAVAVASCSDASQVLLTDGNHQSVLNVEAIVERNQETFGDTRVSTQELRWDEMDLFKDLKSQIDVIICADCFFFDECRSHLVDVIDFLLKPTGEAIMFAPSRGDTFIAFETLAKDRFRVRRTRVYDDMVWQLHLSNSQKGREEYDADLHYPLMLQLSRISE